MSHVFSDQRSDCLFWHKHKQSRITEFQWECNIVCDAALSHANTEKQKDRGDKDEKQCLISQGALWKPQSSQTDKRSRAWNLKGTRLWDTSASVWRDCENIEYGCRQKL